MPPRRWDRRSDPGTALDGRTAAVDATGRAIDAGARSSGLDRALGRLGSVTLSDLLDAAELLTRVDRKYLVHESVLVELIERLDPRVRVLEIDGARTFGYASMYFDTPDLVSYHEHAKVRPKRFKVRTRAYLDSGTCALEVKTRDPRGLTVKERVPHALDDRDVLTDEGRTFVAGFEHAARHVDRLVPALRTTYRRATLLLSPDERATLDTGLSFELPDGPRLRAGSWAVVESKSSGHPTELDRVMWALGHRPVLFSKYAVGSALHRPDLPAHRWHRVLHRDLGRSSPGTWPLTRAGSSPTSDRSSTLAP